MESLSVNPPQPLDASTSKSPRLLYAIREELNSNGRYRREPLKSQVKDNVFSHQLAALSETRKRRCALSLQSETTL